MPCQCGCCAPTESDKSAVDTRDQTRDELEEERRMLEHRLAELERELAGPEPAQA